MARAAKKASKGTSKGSSRGSAKARGGAKAASRPAAKKSGAKAGAKTGARTASAKGGAAKRGATKTTRRQQSGGAENWFGALNTLMTSAPGREIIAEVLEAAASALRRQRANMNEAMEAGAERMSDATGAAANVATEMAVGTVELAQTAATVLADVVADAARSVLPGGGGDDEDERGTGRSGARQGGGS